MQIFETRGRYYCEKYIFRHKRGQEDFSSDSPGFYAWFDSEFKPGLQFTSGTSNDYIVVALVTGGAYEYQPENRPSRLVSAGEFTISGPVAERVRAKHVTSGKSSCFRKCFLLSGTPFARRMIQLFFPEGSVRKKVADISQVEEIMDRIREAFLHAPEGSDAPLCGLLAELLELVRNSEDQDRETAPPPLLEKALNYIGRELGNPALNREKITREINCSISTLNRLFHKFCHCSVNQYIMEERLKRAREMLLLPTLMRSKEVAEAAGFGSVIYMNRLFKKKYGLTPSRCRAGREHGKRDAFSEKSERENN